MTAQSFTRYQSYIGLLVSNTLLTAAMPMLIILGGLVGMMLAPSPMLATLPPSVQTLAGLLTAGPFSLLMGRFGRRAGFAAGAALAIVGGLLGAMALWSGSFLLLCLAHMTLGAALACYQYFRFAAAEIVPPTWQPVAISLMLTSGLFAAFAGPQIFIWTKDAVGAVPLAGAYTAISAISLIGVLPLILVRSDQAGTPTGATPRKRKQMLSILRRPEVRKAVGLGALSQGTMVLLMAPTPLAMIGCSLSDTQAGDVIRWHVVAMFAPSFFTGFVIRRLGPLWVVRLGLVFLTCAGLVAASGLMLSQFYIALILLGLGWNFGFIGATAMLSTAVPVEDRPIAQGANDTILALASTLCAFASGAVVTSLGWQALTLGAVPVLLLTLLLQLPTPRRPLTGYGSHNGGPRH